ncbi:MAG: hypothetical protein QW508_05635 [Conexivisphaerales archaeon]
MTKLLDQEKLDPALKKMAYSIWIMLTASCTRGLAFSLLTFSAKSSNPFFGLLSLLI